MSVSLCPTFGVGFQAFTTGGLPLNAGLIYTYIAGGTTPQATYTTSAGNVQNANPIVLGADGRIPSEVWLTDGVSYRFDVKDSLGNLIKTYDNIYGIGSAAISTSSGASLIGFIQSGTGAVAGTVQGELRKILRASQFSGVDFGAQLQAAHDAMSSSGGIIDCTDMTGAQTITSTVTLSKPVRVYLPESTISSSAANPVFSLTTSDVQLIGLGGSTIIRLTGSISQIGIKAGFQVGACYRIRLQALQVDKTAGATSGVLISFRNVFDYDIDRVQCGNRAVSTGSTTDNILLEECIFGRILVRSEYAGRYGLFFSDITSSAVDASNLNAVLPGSALSFNTTAGAFVKNSQGNSFSGVDFEDLGGSAIGQHGVLLEKAVDTKIMYCWFEALKSTSNCVRGQTTSSANLRFMFNLSNGGPTNELQLDYCSGAQIHFNHSATVGTFATVTANTDRAWFMGNVASSATTYVSDSGTNTIQWGNKSGDAVMTSLRMANAAALYGLDNAGNLRSLASVDGSNLVQIGDANNRLYFNGADINFNGGVRTSFYPATPAAASQTACSIYAGSGAPNNANGSNGDIYFRGDGTQAASTVIYHKEGGSWVALITT
jgi:hypothetical protein